ncbi:hypothetical protein [Phocaeicola sp.]
MINYKRLISASIILTFAGLAAAQTSTNSPYTRYGFGQLSDQNFGNSKAMGGIAYGLRNGYQINASNPASYTAIDSLTFLFDAGMTLQNANFKEGSVKTNAKNSSFDYLAMQFRLWKKMGMTVGFLPFSSVGYSLSNTEKLTEDADGNVTNTTASYDGDGSLQQVFVGLGYKVFNNLSVGANFSYLYGDITHSVSTAFSNSSAYRSVRMDQISISDYKLDFGLQYSYKINKKNVVNLGAVYSLGHSMNGTGYKSNSTYAYNSTNGGYTMQSQSVDTLKNAFSLPHTFGVGLTYVYDNRLTVGVDYTLQKWQDTKFYNEKSYFCDRSKIAVGAEYIPDFFSHNYLKRIRYRVGAYYSDPYAKVDGKDGAREYGVSAGFGLPIFQSKSILNISGQYVKVSPKVTGMLEENYLKINIGLTFNERWFMKWKVN